MKKNVRIQKKFRAIGINHWKDLLPYFESERNAQAVWRAEFPLSLKAAKLIKKKTGASLDFLFG